MKDMIYVTGDMHADENRISRSALKMLNEGDTLIICGDFGFLWDGGKRENKLLNSLAARSYNICFVDGTHENFELLNGLPVSEWCGGNVHKLRENVIHLMRGQLYTIDGCTVFTMGGGEKTDMEFRDEPDAPQGAEVPTKEEMLQGVNRMEKAEYRVDYIITHEPPSKTKDFLTLSTNSMSRMTALSAYFDELSSQCEYKKWYFGSMHIDKFISASQTAVFKNIIDAQTGMKV